MDEEIEMIEGEEQGQAVPCVHIYAMPDGSFVLEQSEAPAPQGQETAPSLEEAMSKAAEMLQGPSTAEDDAMASAQAGYNRRAKPPMSAPGIGALFGE